MLDEFAAQGKKQQAVNREGLLRESQDGLTGCYQRKSPSFQDENTWAFSFLDDKK